MKLPLLIATTILFASCGETENPAENANNKKALEAIRREAKVNEAIITEANILYASVEDDGTSRKGYAQYLCGVLAENQATTKWVKVVKVNSIQAPAADNAFGVLLGESQGK